MYSFLRKFLIGIAIAIGIGIGGLILLSAILIVLFIYLLVAQAEYDRFADPTGQYEVVITYPKVYHFIPAMPGQGNDMSGNIAIYDREGNFYGGDSLDFVRDGHSIEWTETGASLQFVGEWDFEAGTYSYWSEDGRLIVEQVRK